MFKQFVGCFVLFLVMSVGFTSQAVAALDLTFVTFPMTAIEAVAALVVTAAAAIWIIHKVLTLIRKG